MTLDIFGVGNLDEVQQSELIRKHLLNLTTSYSDEADIFTEIVQNAVDAITLGDPQPANEPDLITVVIGRRKNHAHYLYVQDNGVGMSSDLVNKVFIPGFSSGKKPGYSIGYKGVGMSYVVAVSEHVAIRSVKGSNVAERTILHANDWVMDSEKPAPLVDETFQAPGIVQELASNIKRGTGVYFSFHPASNPSSLDNLVIQTDGANKELKYWAGFLCARTPIGIASTSSTTIDRKIQIRIILDHGEGATREEALFRREGFDLDKESLGYPYPEKVFKVGIDISQIDSTREGERHVKHSRRHQAVFHEWPAAEFLEEMTLGAIEKTLLVKHLTSVRAYLCYSTDVLKVVKDTLGTRAQVVRYGARLAVDGVPQGRALDVSLTSDVGLERQTHVVLSVSDLELDTGRKFVSNELMLDALNKVSQRAVTRLKEYRWALKIKDKAPIDADINEWVNNVDGRAGNSTIPLLFDTINSPSPSRVDPDNEQEVIALWTSLLTANTLQGFEMKAISGFNRYDALINLRQGVLDASGDLAALSPDFDLKQNAVLEFKWHFETLIVDFESKVKIPRELDLVVCWDVRDVNLRVGSLEPTYGKWSHERPYRGVSYVWSDDSNSVHFQVIALRNVVAELLASRDVMAGKAALEVLENRDSLKIV